MAGYSAAATAKRSRSAFKSWLDGVTNRKIPTRSAAHHFELPRNRKSRGSSAYHRDWSAQACRARSVSKWVSIRLIRHEIGPITQVGTSYWSFFAALFVHVLQGSNRLSVDYAGILDVMLVKGVQQPWCDNTACVDPTMGTSRATKWNKPQLQQSPGC